MLKDTLGPKKITDLEIGYAADTRYEDKYKARIQQHRSLCQVLEIEGHEVKLYPIILEMQGSVFNCFKSAMSAVGIQAPQQVPPLAAQLQFQVATRIPPGFPCESCASEWALLENCNGDRSF